MRHSNPCSSSGAYMRTSPSSRNRQDTHSPRDARVTHSSRRPIVSRHTDSRRVKWRLYTRCSSSRRAGSHVHAVDVRVLAVQYCVSAQTIMDCACSRPSGGSRSLTWTVHGEWAVSGCFRGPANIARPMKRHPGHVLPLLPSPEFRGHPSCIHVCLIVVHGRSEPEIGLPDDECIPCRRYLRDAEISDAAAHISSQVHDRVSQTARSVRPATWGCRRSGAQPGCARRSSRDGRGSCATESNK
ncbi:hypothetical protein K466DRAFT_157489 [Polyporus arcularius HHB13444]|uniref:Uncharacterized protein n=1 Tax=Polyporus arcularius HHB13444 TaxID=1314778 RepID=A0A5C3PAI3_9APHY|nr:hypothetical protein K466DRAFT_157489 [Polyporus arcularius HHB13444]